MIGAGIRRPNLRSTLRTGSRYHQYEVTCAMYHDIHVVLNYNIIQEKKLSKNGCFCYGQLLMLVLYAKCYPAAASINSINTSGRSHQGLLTMMATQPSLTSFSTSLSQLSKLFLSSVSMLQLRHFTSHSEHPRQRKQAPSEIAFSLGGTLASIVPLRAFRREKK